MDRIGSMNQFEEYRHLNNYVIYVNPRQYDRIIRRRMERDRFLEKRGKPKPSYVPIAIRDYSLRFVQNNNFLLSYDKKWNFMNQNISNNYINPNSSNINIYINNPINNTLGSANVNNGMNNLGFNQMGNHGVYNNGYMGVFNGFANGDKHKASQNTAAYKFDAYSPVKCNKYGNMYYNSYKINNNYGYADTQPDKDLFMKLDPFSGVNEFYNTYENYFNSPLSSSLNMAASGISSLYNTQNFNSNLYITNNVTTFLTGAGIPNSHASSSTFDKDSSKDKDSSSVCSSSSREEIKNNYLLLHYSPYSESSIDSDVVPKTEHIYNINEHGIIFDTNFDTNHALAHTNPVHFESADHSNATGIAENVQDYNYIANSSLLANNAPDEEAQPNADPIKKEKLSIGSYSKPHSRRARNEHKRMFKNTPRKTNYTNDSSNTHKKAYKDNKINYPPNAKKPPNVQNSQESTYLYKQLYDCFTNEENM